MSAANDVISRAYAMMGVRYVLGAESTTAVDCSGLIYRCFVDSGHGDLINNERRRAAGYANFFAAEGNYTHFRAMQPGDLITYTHGSTHVAHIGIYVGQGRVISALTTTGVTEHGIDRLDVDFAGVCLVPYEGARSGGDDAGGDGDEDPANATDSDINNQPDNIGDVDAGIGYTPNRSAQFIAPIRHMSITFPTPTDAKFDFTMSQTYDQAFLGADVNNPEEPPGPVPPPIDYIWYSEHVPVLPPGGYAGNDFYTGYPDMTFSVTPRFIERDGPEMPSGYWTLPNPGAFVQTGTRGGSSIVPFGLLGGYSRAVTSVYSAVGICDGWIANIPYYATSCGIGYGGFIGGETNHMWFEVLNVQGVFDNDPADFAFEVTFSQTSVMGAARGITVEFIESALDWEPG